MDDEWMEIFQKAWLCIYNAKVETSSFFCLKTLSECSLYKRRVGEALYYNGIKTKQNNEI